MIQLDNAHNTLDPNFLDAPGGFAWWYLEILDSEGNGLVLIWSFGLPFLPGYASSARQGKAQAPRQRPSLNIALYKEGSPVFYVLHEFCPDDAEWDGAGHWRFGESTMTSTTLPCGTREVDVELDCPLLGSNDRIQGRIRASGPTVKMAPGAKVPVLGKSSHAWTPLMSPSFGTAMFRWGDEGRFRVAGRVYHDRNGSAQGLHDIGIKLWVWGHTSLQDAERIFYILWPHDAQGTPECVGFEVDAKGVLTPLEDLEVELPNRHTTLYGMPTWEHWTLKHKGEVWMRSEAVHEVDKGPFYLRYLTRVSVPGHAPCHGSVEVIDPSRIDLARHRFLVKMRVATDKQANSVWLPLFQGDTQGRVGRLFRQLTQPRVIVRRGEP